LLNIIAAVSGVVILVISIYNIINIIEVDEAAAKHISNNEQDRFERKWLNTQTCIWLLQSVSNRIVELCVARGLQ
jgi:hypothetical protein